MKSSRTLRLGLTTLLALLLPLPVTVAQAAEPCAPSTAGLRFESRHARLPSATSADALRSLVESPVVFARSATFTNEDGARIQTLTEAHAVYPINPAHMMAGLQDAARLTGFMPNLAEHEVVCSLDGVSSRQRQRTDFGVLVFSLGAEYLIDVLHVETGPETFASQWALVDSVDGRLGFLYGSWFFESVDVDGTPMTYVRHYVRTGLTTRVPGVRGFVNGRLESQIVGVFEALYAEAIRRAELASSVSSTPE